MTDFKTEFENRVTELREKILGDLGNGCARDYATYRQLVGRVESLDDAIKIISSTDQ